MGKSKGKGKGKSNGKTALLVEGEPEQIQEHDVHELAVWHEEGAENEPHWVFALSGLTIPDARIILCSTAMIHVCPPSFAAHHLFLKASPLRIVGAGGKVVAHHGKRVVPLKIEDRICTTTNFERCEAG